MTRTRAKNDPFWATSLHRMQPGPQRIVRGLYALVQRSPALRTLWFGSGWRRDSSEHGSGRAIDVIVTENTGMRPTQAEHAAAMAFIAWLIANARALGIQWILYSTDGKNRTQSWNADRGTWRNLANRGSISANHIDHIHIYFKPGADWPKVLDAAIVGAATNPAPKPTPGLPGTGLSGKTDTQLAQEVIAGKHGNGDARRRSLGARYAAVQAEVNRILRSRPKPGPPKTSRYRVVTNSLPLNGRAGPGTNHRVTMTANKGAILTVVETRNGWARSTGGHWYSMQYLRRI